MAAKTSVAFPRPPVWSFTASLRNLWQHSVDPSPPGNHSTLPNANTRPSNTRLYHSQAINSMQPVNLARSPAGSSESLDKSVSSYPTSSTPGDHSPTGHDLKGIEPRPRADPYQTESYFVPGAPSHLGFSRKGEGLKLSSTADVDVEAMAANALEKHKIEPQARSDKDITPSRRGPERQSQKSSWLRRFSLHWLTAYRILIALTVIINVVILVLLVTLRLPLENVLAATAANLLVSILTRQEDLLNLGFGLVARIPSSLPTGLRKIIADFHHYGGVHIGTAISSLAWYVLFVGLNTARCVMRAEEGTMTRWHWADIATCYAFLTFILLICLSAIPLLREKFHNHFEHTHRFAGWASLIVLWINSGIRTIVDPSNTPLYKSPSIWMLALATSLIILPWLRIRRVPIVAQPISAREVKLVFPYANMPYTSTCRFSLSPLMEWQAFATIPSPDNLSASIIISAAGDWTKNIIANPPSRIWIRHPPTANFLAFTPLFNSVLLVATGAGIGPMLSLLASPSVKRMLAAGKKVRVMWCVYDPSAAHWDFVQEAIRKIDPLPTIFDSKTKRPDVAFEARYAMQTEGLEAVMVVSNKKVTNEVVREVKAYGGAAYGAVFDS